jgi:hypothetical protein
MLIFLYSGKIRHMSVESSGSSSKTATITFDEDTAANTALLLDSTQLGAAQVSVLRADTVVTAAAKGKTTTDPPVGVDREAGNGPSHHDFVSQTHPIPSPAPDNTVCTGETGYYGNGSGSGHFSQSDKPRTRILAEYLAHGYHITDRIQKAWLHYKIQKGSKGIRYKRRGWSISY